MKKNSIRELLLTATMTFSFFVPSHAAGFVEGLLLLTPAAVGSYGTYKTLTEQPSVFVDTFAQACRKFSNAMSRTDSQHPSMVVRAFFNNLKHFKTHQKMAMAGSAGALLVGMVLVPIGFLGSLASSYKYLRATDKEKKLCEKNLRHFATLWGVGTLSLLTAAALIPLIADYAQSGNAW